MLTNEIMLVGDSHMTYRLEITQVIRMKFHDEKHRS